MINFTVFIFDNNVPRFSLPILQENAFLNNRIVIFVSNRSKCVFVREKNRKPEPAVGVIYFEILNKKGAFKLPPLK